MAARVMLNKMLTSRGFKNLTPNYGFGKTNAKWENDYYVVERVLREKGFVQVIVTNKESKGHPVAKEYIISDGERDQTAIDKIIKIVSSIPE